MGTLVDSQLSRQNPLHSTLGLRLEPESSRGWIQAEWEYAGKADKLSLRDEGDTLRIPPGGTPEWSVVNLRGGYTLGSKSTLTLAVENLFDANYRIHGSGQNEPGINVVLGFVFDW
jgi:hemoglobin/transferrin/lactoferrin receptor protein